MTPDAKTMEQLVNLTDEQIMAMEAPPSGGVLFDSPEAGGVVDLDTPPPPPPVSLDQDADPNKGKTEDELAAEATAQAEANAAALAAADDAGGTGKPADGEGAPAAGTDAAPVVGSGAGTEELGADGKPKPKEPPAAGEQAVDGEGDGKGGIATEVTPEMHKAAYDLIMGPIKANGKEIQVRTPEEAKRLIQMGANYTVKMQELQPQKRIIKMLGNHGLLDEGKLSYLIDLDKKNPQAIAKLIKDAGINPMDLNTEDAAYQAPNHSISDAEMEFTNAIDAINVDDAGKALLKDISGWDQASKAALGQDPSLLSLFAEHKQSGVYDKIDSEVQRLRTIDPRYAAAPYVQCYNVVGNAMKEQGLLAPPQQQAPPAVAAPAKPAEQAPPAVPLATRVATQTPPAGADKVRAAAPARSAPTAVKVEKNPLDMSDEDFAKEMNGRL